jgi:hypothetical protein
MTSTAFRVHLHDDIDTTDGASTLAWLRGQDGALVDVIDYRVVRVDTTAESVAQLRAALNDFGGIHHVDDLV